MSEAFVPGKLDTPEITAELRKAEALAGDDRVLKFVQMQQSKMNDKPTFDRAQVVEPIQLFDNLYFIGNPEMGSFVFKTSEGLIMIDSCFQDHVETNLIPGFEKLGLNPADVKYMCITHAGPDHFGGAYYFNKNFGTKIVMSQEEFSEIPSDEDNQKIIERRATPGYEYNHFNLKDMIYPPRECVIYGEDGAKLTLGDTTLQIVKTPRKVGRGGLSYLATVYDNGTPHVWCTYGNTNVTGNQEDMKLYRESVAKFLKYVDEMGADVVISNHPFVDDSVRTIEVLRNRKEGEPNPFIYGKEKVRRFFEVLDQCSVVIAMRRALGYNEAGCGPYVPGVLDLANGSINPSPKE